MAEVPEGRYITLFVECNHICHSICFYSDGKDKRFCSAKDRASKKCQVCPKKCMWYKHESRQFTLHSVDKIEWAAPGELIKQWNRTTNTLEGAVIDALDRYLELQNLLRSHIYTLQDIKEQLRAESERKLSSAAAELLKMLDGICKRSGCFH